MSERGGGAVRRGRGFGARGGPRGGFKRQYPSQQQHEQDGGHVGEEAVDEAPEVKTLREKYGNSVSTVQAVFPEWDDESTLFALGEANGSIELAISRIAEGQAEQWGSVKPKKQTTRKDSEHPSESFSHPSRGAFAGRGRGRGDFPGRGGRGGFRGGARGGRGGAVSGRQPPQDSSATEASVTEITEVSANDDGSVTTTTVTEVSGEGIKEVSVAESNTDAAGTTVQVEETIAVVEAPKAATNGWGQQKSKAQAPSPAVAAAKKTPQPGVKLSWAQIARPPSPKQQPAPAPKAAEPVKAAAPVEAAAPASEPEAETAAQEPEPIVVVEVEIPVAEDAQTAPEDPWSSTPAAAVIVTEAQQASDPAALSVGEGWADSILAKNDLEQAQQATPEQQEQHQRAQEAAPPAGIDPAGQLDVHTPTEIPAQQPSIQQNQSLAPPGLNKRSSAARTKQQDAAVVMPGATPGIESVGLQFGSLNLFGSVPTEQSSQEEAAPQQQQQQQHHQSQQSLYETQVAQQEQQQQPVQSYQETAQQAPAPYDIQQQAQAQYQQAQAQKQAQSGYGGSYDRFGAPQHHQQQQQQPAASAYSSRYQPFGQAGQQQQQQQQPQDPFASITSPYMQNLGRGGNVRQQQPSVPSLTGADSISPYYSSQQAQNLQSHQSTQTHQAAPLQTSASPAPQSVRDSAGSVPPQQAASGYGGFTSALGQATQAQQQQAYPTDYANLYGMQNQMRTPNYYSQYEQPAQQSRPGTTDDLTSKLAATAGSAAAAPASQQQPQQQQQLGQQPYMPYGAYPSHYYPYGQYGNYPGYAPQHYQPYGYGAAQRAGFNGNAGAQQYPQAGAATNTGYQRSSNSFSNNASAGHNAQQYNSSAYGSFDNQQSAQGHSSLQGAGAQVQQGQQDTSKDPFGDDRYFNQY